MGSSVRLGVEVQQGGGRNPRVLSAVLGLERLEGIAASPYSTLPSVSAAGRCLDSDRREFADPSGGFQPVGKWRAIRSQSAGLTSSRCVNVA